MISKFQITFLALVFGLVLLIFACDDQPQVKQKKTPDLVTGKITQPIVQKMSEKSGIADKKNTTDPETDITAETKPDTGKIDPALKEETAVKEPEQYDSQGKIDPFKPLIQETPKIEPNTPIVDDRPKRILTPLEKIELSQIRLVAVIIMKGKQIAMVEEASGKGYEVGIGTYIGKNQGRVSEIKNSSILITELVSDYKGRRKEHVQEIKLHKNDYEE